ncbi:MAG: hypothetical protein ABEL51_03400 [Salinibacter sp.]
MDSSTGPEIKLFGTAFERSAVFPSPTKAEKVASRLANLGFNFVRLSKFSSIFESKNPPQFNLSKRDRFFNFIGELKSNGIYVSLTLPNCGNLVTSQPSGMFVDSKIQCQKDLASALLEEDPNVSGLNKLKNDPVLAAVKFNNEVSLFLSFIGCELDPNQGCNTAAPQELTQDQSEILDTKWNNRLQSKFNSRDDLEDEWRCSNKIGLRDSENPADGTVERIEHRYDDGSFAFQHFCLDRVIDETTFYYQVEQEYVKEMESHLKNNLGLEIPITTIENYYGIPSKMTQAETGTMAHHAPWVHPCTFSTECSSGGFMNPPFEYINYPMVKGPVPSDKRGDGLGNGFWPAWIELRNTIWRLTVSSAVKGKPYIISEYNHPLPNEFQAEFPLLISAYARFQGWDGIVLHSYADTITSISSSAAIDANTNKIENGFEIGDNPAVLSQIPAAARVFRNGWVSEANQTVTIPFWEDGNFNDNNDQPGAINDWWDCKVGYYCYWEKSGFDGDPGPQGTVDQRIDPALSLIHKTQMQFSESPSSASGPTDSDVNSPYVSDTNELRWNTTKGLLTIDTPWINAAVGCHSDGPNGCTNTDPNLSMLEINASTDFAAISAVPLDKEPLSSTRTLLLTTVGRIKNTNMEPAPPNDLGGQTLTDWGDSPVKLQSINAQITLTLPQAQQYQSLNVYPLDEQGNKKSALSNVTQSGDSFTFDVGNHQTPWYMVEMTGDTTVFRVERTTGNVFLEGSLNSNGADLAERIETSEPVEPGDVVAIDPQRPGHYRKTQHARSTRATGVIASDPGIVLGAEASRPSLDMPLLHLTLPNWISPSVSMGAGVNFTLSDRGPSLAVPPIRTQPKMALMGQVPVKASTENGPIQPGDLLVSASTPGHVMRCAEPETCQGAIVGKALEALTDVSTGRIRILVMR